MGTSALALTGNDTGEVTRTVAEDRHHGTVERGEHHLTDLSVGNGLQGVRINDLQDVVVLPQVHAILLLALKGHARSVHLGHTERVVGFHAQESLDATALLIGMGLGTDKQGAELRGARIDTLLLEHLGQTHCIRGDSVQTGGTEILDEHDLSLGVTGSSGHRGGSQLLGSILEAQSAGEHTVAGGVLENIRVAASHHVHVTGDHVGP